jgi:hypothetical protein
VLLVLGIEVGVHFKLIIKVLGKGEKLVFGEVFGAGKFSANKATYKV